MSDNNGTGSAADHVRDFLSMKKKKEPDPDKEHDDTKARKNLPKVKYKPPPESVRRALGGYAEVRGNKNTGSD